MVLPPLPSSGAASLGAADGGGHMEEGRTYVVVGTAATIGAGVFPSATLLLGLGRDRV